MTNPLKVHGVDISRHQGGVNIDWTKLKKAGVQWMYHKATEGGTFKDEHYSRRRKQAKDNGMPFGAYHFARPSGSDARAEARFFAEVAQPRVGDLRPCLDLETIEYVSGNALLTWADAFCDELEKQTQVVPVVYTPYNLSPELEKHCLFWVPRYNNTNSPPVRRWDIWQFSNGRYGVPNFVPGLGNVDLNHSKVPLDALLIKPEHTPTSRGRRVDQAIDLLKEAERLSKEGTERDTLLDRSLRILKSIKPTR